MSGKLAWGILGTGNIARQFAAGLKQAQRGGAVSVGSRSPQTARTFAQAHGIGSHGSYDAVLSDPRVQAVYVSLPNSMHHEWTLRALRAGKHVLCEKPLAANMAQAQEMFAVAAQCGRVLVEAFMYRSHPQTSAVLAALRDGAVGRLQLIRTSFCYRTDRIEGNIRFDASLAGGALMDIGCYCIDFARLVTGADPLEYCAYGHLHASGVDEMAGAVMRFPDDVLCSFTCGMRVQADNTAWICGSDGYIQIPVPWKPAAGKASFTVAHSTPPRMDSAGKPAGRPPIQEFPVPDDRDLYGIEADDFAAVVLDHQPPRMRAEDSIANMRILDQMRRQVGVKF